MQGAYLTKIPITLFQNRRTISKLSCHLLKELDTFSRQGEVLYRRRGLRSIANWRPNALRDCSKARAIVLIYKPGDPRDDIDGYLRSLRQRSDCEEG